MGVGILKALNLFIFFTRIKRQLSIYAVLIKENCVLCMARQQW